MPILRSVKISLGLLICRYTAIYVCVYIVSSKTMCYEAYYIWHYMVVSLSD